jgi:hypothetical protein
MIGHSANFGHRCGYENLLAAEFALNLWLNHTKILMIEDISTPCCYSISIEYVTPLTPIFVSRMVSD